MGGMKCMESPLRLLFAFLVLASTSDAFLAVPSVVLGGLQQGRSQALFGRKNVSTLGSLSFNHDARFPLLARRSSDQDVARIQCTASSGERPVRPSILAFTAAVSAMAISLFRRLCSAAVLATVMVCLTSTPRTAAASELQVSPRYEVSQVMEEEPVTAMPALARMKTPLVSLSMNPDISVKEVAKAAGKFSLGFICLLPILSRLVRAAAEFLKKLAVPRDCITVTLVQVVLTGDEAAKMKAGLNELSFKRDELADRMRWAVRHDVSIKDAQLPVRKSGDDALGESSIARQAARLLLSAKQRGGWVAGKVDVQSFLYKQTQDAQLEFFAQCSKVRDTYAKIAGTVGVGRAKDRVTGSGVSRLRRSNSEMRDALGKKVATPPPFPEGSPDRQLTEEEQKETTVSSVDPSRQYFVASIVTATIGALGLAPNQEDAASSLFTLKTPQTLQDMVKLTDENLLSLEVLWAPEADGTPLTKDEVMSSLEAPRSAGYASVQSVDLYGMAMN